MSAHLPPQIHQKYIYKYNDSHRISTECWQKTSDFWKGNNPSHNSLGQKNKGKIEFKWEPRLAPQGGSYEGGKLLHPGKSLLQ